MLAVSVDGFLTYQRDEAWTWEHMALCRARPLFGSEGARIRLYESICEVLRSAHDPVKVRQDATTMRLDMVLHKPASGPLDIKLGPGGLVDLEFATHTLQLSHGVAFDPRLEVAVEKLAERGLVEPSIDADLRLLSRMLVCMRLMAPDGREPELQSRSLLATLCGHLDWEGLLAAHDAARHRVAQLWQRVQEGS
jgi:glutamate-ammonia-ligase adenylyltransferase